MQDKTPHLASLRGNVIPPLKAYDQAMIECNEGKRHVKRVLAIDPGKTNVALAYLDLEHESHLTTKIVLPDDVIHNASKFYYNELVIEHWIRMFRPDVIFKEAAALGMKFGVADAGRLQYVVERLGIQYQIPVITVNNSTMRKYVNVGDGTKSSARLRIFQRWGVEFQTEDETDAFAIGKTGIAILTGEIDVKGKKKKK